jgi:hypothetical protein
MFDAFKKSTLLLKPIHSHACSWVCGVQDYWVEDFSSTGQLVTLGLVDSSIGAMAKGLALVDVEALVVKDMLLSLKYSMCHCVGLALRTTTF